MQPPQSTENPEAPIPKPARPATPRRRKALFILVILAFFVAVGAAALEGGLRVFCPWLMPQKLEYTRDLGLPRAALDTKWGLLKNGPYDLVAIGDSYVETGSVPVGWITRLGKSTGKRIMEIGFQGACPSQYFALLDRLRAEGNHAPVLILVWLGNDCFDESLWERQGADKSTYFGARFEILSDSGSPFFWPGCDVKPWSWFSAHLASYRAWVLAKSKVMSRFDKQPTPAEAADPEWSEREMRRLTNERCDKQPWAEWVGGRLYLFREHAALVNPDSPEVRRGGERILELLRAHKGDPALTVAVALDQEEISEPVHGRKVPRAAPFIEKMRETGVKILDLNPPFIQAAREKPLYYGDGHWNSDAHALVAEEIKKYYGF